MVAIGLVCELASFLLGGWVGIKFLRGSRKEKKDKYIGKDARTVDEKIGDLEKLEKKGLVCLGLLVLGLVLQLVVELFF